MDITIPFTFQISHVSLKVFALCCVILFFKMSAIVIFQAIQRSKTKYVINPEDKLIPGAIVGGTTPELDRSNNAFRNDFENIPIFLFLALSYVLLNCWETGAIIYFSTFTFARCLHTFSYLKALQPWRSISFGIGLLMSNIVAIHIIIKVLNG